MIERSSGRRPYWLMAAVCGALVLSPPVWATVALVTGAVALTLAGGIRGGLMQRALEARVAQRGDVTVLGRDPEGRQVVVSDDELSAHGLIVGASGSGKSTTLLTILGDHVRRGRPVVAIDLKGSPAFASELAQAAHAASRPFRIWTLDGPSQWNPLAHGNPTELKDKLIATERFTEPHYQRAAERYLQMALLVLREVRPDRAPTLPEVVELMSPRVLNRLAERLGDRAARVGDYIAGLTPDQISAVRGLGTRLAIISESHVGRFLGGPAGWAPPGAEIDLRRALSGEEVVCFSLNSSSYGKLAAQVGALAVQDLVTAAGHRLTENGGRPLRGEERAIVAIDEFSALDGDVVLGLIARSREAGMSLLVATQELADLDRAARGLRDQVIGSTAIKLVHRQEVPASARSVAEMAGTVKRWQETEIVPRSWIGPKPLARGTRRLQEEFLVHPNQIKGLRTGELIAISKTPQPIVRAVQVAPPCQPGRPSRPPRELARARDGRRGPEIG